jgi:Arc/MetJ-type ribon-helix-helix transcriptional regulator
MDVICKGYRGVMRMVRTLVDVKTRVPEKVLQFINELVERGYYSSVADFSRQAILDKLITDFELGITELEPDLIEPEDDASA